MGRIFHSTLGSGDLGDEAFPARCPLCDEFDGCRALYLDAALDRPGPGMARTAALLRRMLAAVEDEALSGSGAGLAIAAE